MPSSKEKRRGQQQRRRQRQRTERRGPLPAVPRPFKDPVRWLNQSIRTLPWERAWLRGVLAEGRLYGACSIARGNGKTTWAGAIAAPACAPSGPLYVEGTAVVIIAASYSQAREAFEAALEVRDPWIKAEPDDWRQLDGQRLLIEHRPTGTKIEVRGERVTDPAWTPQGAALYL